MTDLSKPPKGSGRLARHARRLAQRRHERAEMSAAKRRDHGRCRVPQCPSRVTGMHIDAAHLNTSHRGMGGNPDGSRTARADLISLCVQHHDAYDKQRSVRIVPLTPEQFDGPCAFYREEGDQWVFIGQEKRFDVFRATSHPDVATDS